MKRVLVLCMIFFTLPGLVFAAGGGLQPFVLAKQETSSLEEAQTKVKAALEQNGLDLVGEYQPYAGTKILIVTSEELKAAATKSKHGGFGAVQRIALVQAGSKVQVSYTNPEYMQAAYRMKGDLAPVVKKLAQALGREREYGTEHPKTPGDLRDYHYKVFMPYFDDIDVLAEFASQEQALAAVEKGLAAKKGGTTKVYRVDLPGGKESVIGVAMTEKVSSDKFIMSEIDFKEIKSAAHLPYEILITNGKVIALRAEFRIAINFPDLSMMGANSFMNIMDAPSDIKAALTSVTK